MRKKTFVFVFFSESLAYHIIFCADLPGRMPKNIAGIVRSLNKNIRYIADELLG